MPEFTYAKGRIEESIQFISDEIKEFEEDYADKSWPDYQKDKKLQKLIDRTVENVLTALIEVCGTILTQKGLAVDTYGSVLKECARVYGFSEEEQEKLAKLAIQRNRLAHRYLNFRWQAVKMFGEQKSVVVKLIKTILEKKI